MNIQLEMAVLGLFLIAVGIGTSEASTNRFSFPLGIIIAFIGLGLLFFSEKQYRNPVWLKRQANHLIWKYWPIWS